MDYLQVLKIFRKHYGSNQKYYSDLHPILYYNDDFYTNPFLNENKKDNILKKEDNQFSCLNKYFKNNYSIGINRENFFKLFLSILRKQNPSFSLPLHEIVNQMIYDFDKLNLSQDYNLKQYKISKSLMRNTILDEKFNSNEFIQFSSDYFKFQITLVDSDESRTFYPRNDPLIPSPKLFIYQDIINDRYYQIMIDNKNWIEHNDKIYNDYKKEEPKLEEKKEEVEVEAESDDFEFDFDCGKLMKMKLKEIQDIAKELGINIQKINPRKTRMINKKKDELISELMGKN